MQASSSEDHLAFSLKSLVRHTPAVLAAGEQIRNRSNQLNDTDGDTIGGIIWNGIFGYLATGPVLEVVAIKTGARVSSCNFESVLMTPTNITCVTEIELTDLNTCILAVGLQSDKHGGVVCLFAVEGARILRTIEILHKITSCCFVGGPAICARSDLASFDGCMAVGTDGGRVILVDLALKSVRDVLMWSCVAKTSGDCLICMASVSREEIKRQQKRAKTEDINFGIQLEVLENSGPVLSILSLQPLLSLAVGLSDGRLVLYTLYGLEAFHLAHPPEPDSPLIRMAFIEPADDPRACVYLWAFHTNAQAAVAVMHSIMYQTKVAAPSGSAQPDHIYDDFQSCSVRLTMPIFDRESFPVGCQAISKQLAEDEDKLTLCVLAWTRNGGSASQVCVFDLNQWYKEQMPSSCDWRRSNSFLAVFPLDGLNALDVWMDSASVTPFSSIQRPEEHFYPTSLNFECIGLTASDSCRLHWPGLQNQSLELLCSMGPQAILEPHQCVAAMTRATLHPQFIDYNPHIPQSIKTKQELLLSVALEYNCVSLLRECARAWADGSHVGAEPQQGLSLSTLTDWIWARAGATKDICNTMCVSLFDHSGAAMDLRAQKRLLHCARQLKTLADLMHTILTTYERFIPSEVMVTLESQRNSIRMAHEYQEVLQWLLNMGLLPEGSPNSSRQFDSSSVVPYPYQALRQFYASQRQKFADMDPQLLNAKRSCRILYIDTFIERMCEPACLRAEWRKGAGDGLYPPPSLQAMLRTLLVPGVDVELKYTLFVYLFLDLSVALDEERFAGVIQRLIKFPAVFKMNPALIKTTQAFWNLDHGQFETAIEELISPLSQERHLHQWQQEILIESLLVQEAPHLALRALRAPGPPIAPLLEIRTLLANNLVAEAFQLQRSKADQSLLYEFFKTCHEQQKWHFVLDLSLNNDEEESLGSFLRTAASSLTTNLHFLYLLQRTKYIEAISFIDNLQRTSAGIRRRGGRATSLDTPNTIVAAYKLTMTPATRAMSEIYYSLKDNINTKLNQTATNPNPLSTKLLQSKLDLVGGVYHRTVLSAEQTTPAYWLNQPKKQCNLSASNVPFLRNPQYDMMELVQKQHMHHNTGLSHAAAYTGNQKRNLNESDTDVEAVHEKEKAEGPKKRRRIDPTAEDFPIITSRAPKTSTFTMDTTLSTPIVESTEDRSPPKRFDTDRAPTPMSILKTKPIPGSPARSVRIRSVSPSSSDSNEEKGTNQFHLPSDLADGFRSATPVATSTVLVTSKNSRHTAANSTTVSGNDSLAEDYFSPEISQLEAEEDVHMAKSFEKDDDLTVSDVEKDDDVESDEESLSEKASQVVTPPDNLIRNTLPYSEQDSPLQRRQVLAQGIKPRKRLHSNASDESFSSEIERSLNETIVVEIPAEASTSTSAETPSFLRRSSRSRSKTPDVQTPPQASTSTTQSKSQAAATAVASKSSILQRKPLSRLVLEANAQRVVKSTAIPSTSHASFAESSSASLLNTSVASTSRASTSTTDANQSAFDDTVELSDSFLDRWNAERRAAQMSANSTLNETSSKDPMFSDSDASFSATHDHTKDATGEVEKPDAVAVEADAVAVEAVAVPVEADAVAVEANAVAVEADAPEPMAVDEPIVPPNIDEESSSDSNAVPYENDNKRLSPSDYHLYYESSLDSRPDSSFVRAAPHTDSDVSIDTTTPDPDDAAYAKKYFNYPLKKTNFPPSPTPPEEVETISLSSSGDSDSSDSDPMSYLYNEELFNRIHAQEKKRLEDEAAANPDSVAANAAPSGAGFSMAGHAVWPDDEDKEVEPTPTSSKWKDLKTAEAAIVVEDEVEAEVIMVHDDDSDPSLLPAQQPANTNENAETDSSWLELKTAENSMNLDNAQILDTPDVSAQFEECSSRDVSQLNHAIVRETDQMADESVQEVPAGSSSLEVTVEEEVNELDQGGILSIVDETAMTDTAAVAVDNDSLVVSMNEEVNELDQGYLLEDTSNIADASKSTDAVQPMDEEVDEAMDMAPLVAEPTEDHKAKSATHDVEIQDQTKEVEAMETKEESVKQTTVETVKETSAEALVEVDETVEMAPLVMEPSQSETSPPKVTKREHDEIAHSSKATPDQQATPQKLIKLSSPEGRMRTRARSISIEDDSAAIVSTPRRSTRAKSISKMDSAVPQTPTSTRKLRGTSEPPKGLGTPKNTPIRRLLEESNVQTPVAADANLTPLRRSTRRLSQSSAAAEEVDPPSSGTPARRGRRVSQNISPIAEDTPVMDTPKRRSTRRVSTAKDENDDDSVSVVSNTSRSSVTSTRSTRTKTTATVVDDDSVSVKSGKSTKSTASKKTVGRAKVLPAIDETKESEEGEKNESPAEASASYSSSRRLTRNQITVMERMKKSAQTKAATPQRRATAGPVHADDSDSNDELVGIESSPSDVQSRTSGRSSRLSAKAKRTGTPDNASEQGDGDTPTSGEGSRPRRRTRKADAGSK